MSSRLIDFDDEAVVTVVIGKREFTIRPQRRALIEKIMDSAYKDQVEGSSIKDFFKNWDRQFPLFALIFGYEDLKAVEREDVLKHLEQHVSPRAACRVFEEWWAAKGIQDFFRRGGM